MHLGDALPTAEVTPHDRENTQRPDDRNAWFRADASTDPTMDQTGTVRWFSPKGFGFIARDHGEDAYVHHSAIAGDGFTVLEAGGAVRFGVRATPRGPEAFDVAPHP